METKNFKRKELECKCGCGKSIEDEVFLYCLQELRNVYGRPMQISSGYRCPEYNAKVSPKTGKGGPHTVAAVDVLVSGEDAFRLLWLGAVTGFNGIGVHQRGPMEQRFVHLDRLYIEGRRPWVWTY